jgi:hypothetical protein
VRAKCYSSHGRSSTEKQESKGFIGAKKKEKVIALKAERWRELEEEGCPTDADLAVMLA